MKHQNSGSVSPVFYISVIFVALCVLWGFLFPAHQKGIADLAFGFVIDTFGWFYLLAAFVFLAYAVYLIFGPYGRIKLGKDDDDPDYSFYTWLAMLFSAGMGIGLVFYGVAEPIFHYLSPPEGIPGETAAAAEAALRYSYFHWGFHPWAIYTIIALGLAYFQFRKGDSGLISSTFRPLFGNKVDGALGTGIDSLASIATAFGVATSLGLGVMQINGGLAHVFGLPNTTSMNLLIIAIITLIFLFSASTGINRGIRYLSNINLSVAGGLLLFVLIVGPTFFIIEAFTSTIGAYIGNIIPMSFRMTPFTEGTFVGGWTIFYWAWWIAWAPFVGSFIARISKGRTIKEFVLGVLFVPTVLSMLWFAVFGGSALNLEFMNGGGIAEAVNADMTTALFITLEQFPLGLILAIIATLLIITFFVTSADSATFVLGMFTSKGVLNPKTSTKIVWGILMAGIAAALLYSDGLEGLQTASIVIALPFALLMLIMIFSINKALRKEIIEIRQKDKARFRKLEQLVNEEITNNKD